MQKLLWICFVALLAVGCANNKNVTSSSEMPKCLQEKVVSMSENPSEGTPLYVTRYTYKNKTVYYVASSCCDKFNAVYDEDCNLLGHPDGGLTGKGDGTLMDFRSEATNSKVIWASKNAN